MEVLVELSLRIWSVCLKSEGALNGEREIHLILALLCTLVTHQWLVYRQSESELLQSVQKLFCQIIV